MDCIKNKLFIETSAHSKACLDLPVDEWVTDEVTRTLEVRPGLGPYSLF